MTSLLRSLPVVALLGLIGLSCTTTNITNVAAPAITPTITRFSPDTAWTLRELTIYGTNFGYDPADVFITIDTAQVWATDVNDTVLKLTVPEGARTGLIRVRTYEQTATSAKPIAIRYTFHPHGFYDSLPEGASFSIPGTGMTNHHGPLRISLNGIALPVDSVFSDRVVSHVVPNSYSGTVTIADDSTTLNIGTLFVTVPSSWTTFSQIWDRATFIEFHHLTGYINGTSNTIDSSWRDTVIYDRQIDTNIANTSFVRTSTGEGYSIRAYSSSNPLLAITWNIANKSAYISYSRHSIDQVSPYHTIDTLWSGAQNLTTTGAIGADIEFALSSIGCTITETTTDSTGAVNLRETTSLGNPLSGEIDLILKR